MPIHAAPQRDPRSIVTPDAFEVAPELLGLPLAAPGRRLAALLIDLAVIGLLTLLTKSFGVVLGLVIAVLFIREGFKRTPVRGSAFGRAMRFSVGCLGAWIGIVTVVVWLAVQGIFSRDDNNWSAVPATADSDGPSLSAVIGDTVPEGRVADTTAPDTALGPLADSLVADTLGKLQARVASLTSSTHSQQRQLEGLRTELRQERKGGTFLRTVREFLDILGFGFGWASLYLTVMLPWWKGQTIGKRIVKIRVLRLDGEPITWWTAFERAGGYAAGIATGLLGFAQVYWDSNRQAIHDRIVGTVVVMDGAEKVLDWRKAL
jgi:hypothetical protein